MPRLSQVFLDSVAQPTRFDAGSLERKLPIIVASARAGLPAEIAVTDDRFVGHLAERIPAGLDPDRALDGVQACDLLLACACVAGDATALRLIDERITALTPQLLRATGSDSRIADALQELRVKLFVDGKITAYAGRGSLDAWLRVAATRTLLDLLAGDRREQPHAEPPEDDALLARVDPELELIRTRYHGEFHDAFRAALASLSDEERNVLRLHVIDGLNIGEIGALLGVHRATVARRIADARTFILERTRRGLAERLRVPAHDVASIMELLASRLDASLHRFLAAP